jgi:hypothetical protein
MGNIIGHKAEKKEVWHTGTKEGELRERLEHHYTNNFKKVYDECINDKTCTQFSVGMSEYTDKDRQICKEVLTKLGSDNNLHVECHEIDIHDDDYFMYNKMIHFKFI